MKYNFSVINYIAMVNSLVSNFFDENGDYTPHLGRINAMILFYENCMDDFMGVTYDINDMQDIDKLLNNSGFINEFNMAIAGDGTECMDFSCAYEDALKIVETKNQTFGNIGDIFKKILNDFMEKVTPTIEKTDVDKLMLIADKIAGGEVTADAIVEAYANSIGNK